MFVKAIKSLFAFLFPILKTVALDVLVEELEKHNGKADRRRSYRSYARGSYSPPRRRPVNTFAETNENNPRYGFVRGKDQAASPGDCTECGSMLRMTHNASCSQFVDWEHMSSEEALAKLREKLTGQPAPKPEPERFNDVVLVAFHVRGKNAEFVQQSLIDLLPDSPDGFVDETVDFEMDAWWIADDRIGTGDCDSAVFVHKGEQEAARRLLKRNKLMDGRDDLIDETPVTCVVCRSTQDGVHRVDCAARPRVPFGGLRGCSGCVPINGRHAFYCSQAQ